MDFHEYIDFTQPQSLKLSISPTTSGKKSLKVVTIPAVVTKDQKTLDTIMESQMNRALTVFALNRS